MVRTSSKASDAAMTNLKRLSSERAEKLKTSICASDVAITNPEKLVECRLCGLTEEQTIGQTSDHIHQFWELKFCEKCFCMTNHDKDGCLKCRASSKNDIVIQKQYNNTPASEEENRLLDKLENHYWLHESPFGAPLALIRAHVQKKVDDALAEWSENEEKRRRRYDG